MKLATRRLSLATVVALLPSCLFTGCEVHPDGLVDAQRLLVNREIMFPDVIGYADLKREKWQGDSHHYSVTFSYSAVLKLDYEKAWATVLNDLVLIKTTDQALTATMSRFTSMIESPERLIDRALVERAEKKAGYPKQLDVFPGLKTAEMSFKAVFKDSADDSLEFALASINFVLRGFGFSPGMKEGAKTPRTLTLDYVNTDTGWQLER